MKKYGSFLILMIFLISSCAPIKRIIDPEENFYGYDFREYLKKDFLFLTDKYYGEYQELAIVKLEIYPMGEYQRVIVNPNIPNETYKWEWVFEEVSVQDAINNIYYKSIQFGGDAFVNFSLKEISKINGLVEVNGISISGNIIKRKILK